MRNLINFLIKNNSWFVFIFLLMICFYFVFNNNSYQKSVFLNSSNEVSGKVYTIASIITSYFGLEEENQDLLKQNADLRNQILELEHYLYQIQNDSVKTDAFINKLLKPSKNFEFITARVVENSITKVHNTIIIDKGSNDGVEVDMGALSSNGIVGVVRAVSNNYSVIQSLLNPDSRFSCKVMKNNTPGTLVWDSKDPRYVSLIDFPKYGKFLKGDTIVTSGISEFFPEGIFVGTIEEAKSQNHDDSYTLKVKLSTDFGSLKNVLLFKNNTIEELEELKQKLNNVKQ